MLECGNVFGGETGAVLSERRKLELRVPPEILDPAKRLREVRGAGGRHLEFADCVVPDGASDLFDVEGEMRERAVGQQFAPLWAR